MKLEIGNKVYETKQVTADFPIRFFKKTGKDIFALEDEGMSFIERYEVVLELAYELVITDKTFDEFVTDFTAADLVTAFPNIYKCYLETTKPTVEAEDKEKKQR